MATDLRVGVVGVGSLGFHHARILRDLPGVRLVGVHDTDPGRLAEVGDTLAARTFADPADLAAEVDAAVIAVPTRFHESAALTFLERGIHLLIEKPIAPDLPAAERILATADRSGSLLQIGHVERFNTVLRAAQPYLERVLFVESHRLARFGPRGTDVAVVLDLMIHDLDLVLSVVGEPVAAVAAAGVAVLTTSPDIANARLEFEGGAVANLTASRVSVEPMRKIRFFQRSGYISLDLGSGEGEFLRLRELPDADLARIAASGGLHEIVERIPLRGDGAEPLRRELESFAGAIRGDQPVAVSGEAGRQALAVALEIIARIDEHVAHTHSA